MSYFDELYQKYHMDVYRFLLKMCGYSSDTAEDLTQETFYHAYLSITRFKGECHIKTWLLQIAKNRYLLLLRKKKVSVPFDEIFPEIADTSAETFEQLFEKQLLTDALNIVFEFGENMKEVFILRIYDNLSYSDIAKQLNISESSAKVLFHRGKLKLRKKLREDYGYEI